MKKALFLIVLLISIGLAGRIAGAQERQIFRPYDDPTLYGVPLQMMYEPAPPPSSHGNRIYPGREEYGERYGNIPRHPGDYRDAVDRGQWGPGEPRSSRPFNILP